MINMLLLAPIPFSPGANLLGLGLVIDLDAYKLGTAIPLAPYGKWLLLYPIILE